MFGKLSTAWNKLIGDKSEFSLSKRILNAASLLSSLALIIFVVYNLVVITMPLLAGITLVTFIIQSYFFYLSRWRRKFEAARWAFIIGSYIFLTINYYFSSGINGPVTFAFFLTFVLLIVITHPRRHIAWMALHSIIIIGLLAYQYQTDNIPNAYLSARDRFFDVGATYIIMLIFIYVIIQYVVSNYHIEKKLAEERANSIAQQNRELEYLYAENNRLFSIISHDLRTPLHSIQGYLEMSVKDEMTPEERKMMEKELLTLTKNTSDLLFNLLSWSKTQMSGGRSINLQNVNLLQVLTQTLDTLGQIARNKGINFGYVIPQEVYAVADIEMLQLVVRNLVYNAIKFTSGEGSIQINCIREADNCTISIKDTGTGIPYEKQPSVFSSKIKSSAGTNNERGIGLGLLLCKDFMEMQDGNIWFESVPGKGSTFYISMHTA
jgi:signal transduction histidine kinase